MAVTSFKAHDRQFYSCIVRDLTEQWEIDNRLQRLAAVEYAADAVAIINLDHTIAYVNAQYERQRQCTRAEIIGRLPSGGVDDRDKYDNLWATVGQGDSWAGQIRSHRPDGSFFDEELSVTPVVDARLAVRGYVAILRDVTLRLATEQKLKFLAVAMDHAVDGIHILDKGGFLIYANRAWEQQSDQRLADVEGQRPSNRLLMDPEGPTLRDMIQTTQRGEAWSGVLRSKTPNGGVREDEVTISPIRDEKLQVVSYVIVSRDVTEKKGLEEQLRRAQKLESIGQLAAGIAHEINTPDAVCRRQHPLPAGVVHRSGWAAAEAQ